VSASEWKESLMTAITDFRDTRGIPPVVRLTLADGETIYVHEAKAGPGEGLVTLSPYPPERERGMIRPEGGTMDYTPRANVVPPRAVVKIELLTEVPDATELGFRTGE
jgi:hypothetical protein